ncbi:MAG: wax ester/triacylglycerol synthase family O-acyltransferase [Acidobacteriia bacterium]|nr:wax ester/triacylglycerol synthase family O-acyltransferase [Terriglobia bacterium]
MPRQLPVEAAAGVGGKGKAARRRAAQEQADLKTELAARRLSAVDAAFLYIERKEIPLHMALVTVFDGPIPFEEFVASIQAKMHLIPRYSQIVELTPYNLGYPNWKDDPQFDIRRHIFRVTLEPPGGDEELEDLAGRILSQLMDRSKPLWDIYVIDGLKDGRGAMIARVHHALADGVTGMAILNMLFDATPNALPPVRKPRSEPSKTAPAEPSLAEAIGKVIENTIDGVIAAEASLAGFARALLSDASWGDLKGIAGLLPELAVSVERLPFNKLCAGDRKFCWAEFDFADVKAIRKAAGGTVNDIILAVLTRALARYLKRHHQSVVNRFVRIICPVSLRQGEQNGVLGNQISFMPVALPLDVTDPVRMLKAVSSRTETMKRSGAADLVSLAAGCIAAAPPPLQALFWKGISQARLPVPLFNIICTNIPGSPTPLYAAGRRMIASYPQVPTGYELGINCAVQSYDGKLFFGLIADSRVGRDVHRLRDFLNVSFRELRRAAGVKTAPRKPRQKKTEAAKTEIAKLPELVPAVAPEPEAEAPSDTPPQTPLGVSDKHAA